MSGELISATRGLRRVRIDPHLSGLDPDGTWPRLIGIALAIGFVLVGAAQLDLGPEEARLGLAAGERLGPLGRVVGGWEPSLWPGQVIPSQLWSALEGGMPTAGSVRWPAAIAWAIVAYLISRRAATALGVRASILLTACLLGSLAGIDRSSTSGIEAISGLAVVAALDRILGRGADWVAGVWTALAVLSGGWPPAAMILLPTIAIGRSGIRLSRALLLPPVAAFGLWSIWTLRIAPSQAWGAALTLPLMQGSAWFLVPSVLALALPWTPLAILWASRSTRDGTSKAGRDSVNAWLQVAGVAALAGTLVPGMGTVARLPILVGLAWASAAVLDRAWVGALSNRPRRAVLAVALFSALAAAAILVPLGVYLAAGVSYYRPIAILLVLLSLATALLALGAAWRGSVPRGMAAMLAVALLLKVAHAWVYVPEWNYRYSQGPWGRAVGQWVPPGWRIYTTVSWPADLLLATEHPVRQLPNAKLLEYQVGNHPEFVLLPEAEFERWPTSAPKLLEVRKFEDEFGSRRVLARTEGKLDLLRMTDDH